MGGALVSTRRRRRRPSRHPSEQAVSSFSRVASSVTVDQTSASVGQLNDALDDRAGINDPHVWVASHRREDGPQGRGVEERDPGEVDVDGRFAEAAEPTLDLVRVLKVAFASNRRSAIDVRQLYEERFPFLSHCRSIRQNKPVLWAPS
jgi:hypothetical protein